MLASGWNGLSDEEPLPEQVFMLREAPHAWLFPQMAAVVHHGGATLSGLRQYQRDRAAFGRSADVGAARP